MIHCHWLKFSSFNESNQIEVMQEGHDACLLNAKMAATINGLKVSRKVSYIFDNSALSVCDVHPQEDVQGRASFVHNLIRAYDLMNFMTVLPAISASKEDLLSFHSTDYVEFLENVGNGNDLEQFEDEQEDFGLGYDCPLFEDIYEFACSVTGASLTAAKTLLDGSSDISINWFGGWHHTQRDSAGGFCYVNDIVIAILKLLEKFQRVLYIDLDVHHGDGVENAFSYTDKVLTLSIHKLEDGFYPNTGTLEDLGTFRGKYYSVNVPLKDGIRDDSYCHLFNSIASKVWTTFCPDAVVVQCGADSLAFDPLGGFNLTPVGLGRCIETILSWNKPTLFLGGGGYNRTNVARCWTYLTSLIVGQEIPSEIPENAVDFEHYGPDFELNVVPGNRPDQNTSEYISGIIETITNNLEQIEISRNTEL